MDRMPEVGDYLRAPTGHVRKVLDVDRTGKRVMVDGQAEVWCDWDSLRNVGWRIKEDNVKIEGNREQPQWPDEAFEAARLWLNYMENKVGEQNYSKSDERLVAAVRAEERRRGPQVCGARSEPNEYGVTSVCQVTGPHKRHRETLTTSTGNATTYWYDPPQCERPHLSEAAQGIIDYAGTLQSAMHNRACGPTPFLNDACKCGLTRLRQAISQYDREAKQ